MKTIEEFEAWLYSDESYIPEDCRELFMHAAKERLAWKYGRCTEYDDYDRLIRVFGLVIPGECAWISQEGKIISCNYAYHDAVCEAFIGKVSEVETTHARISTHTRNLADAVKYVKNPSRRMLMACVKFTSERPSIYSWAPKEN